MVLKPWASLPPHRGQNFLQGAPQLVQIRAVSDSESAPPPPPETFGAYTKKHEDLPGAPLDFAAEAI